MTSKQYVVHTYCDFGTPPRKDSIGQHGSVETAKRAFKRTAKIYADFWGWRCWQETIQGEIINDKAGKGSAVSGG